MGRKKIAPTVEWFVNEAVTPGGSTPRAPGTRDQARRELRAVRAVVEAASVPAISSGCGCKDHIRLTKALARLERAGKEEP